ncbi:nucleoside/nucleotide kinase family protein [Mesorhizobium sp. NBSH29]|uniref:nucleoside triphosphate hydrolase n=1 Tax=Mesorhizobium sp. NBSH29 TaxID=2654249 RepID=UPI00189698C7|nr:nucleoside triphosphate hydrolase [Mesorhizobium sp. NBSH29]QPC88571.1 nucleoside/nucleotide kinase family protein [Mesorhizobium sp. NBSH29]
MSEIASLAATIFKRASGQARFVVAIAGPPGAGKSTLADALHELLPERQAVVVAMDGFHYDDGVLEARGLKARKGAPETFDAAGFAHLLKRIRAREPEIAIPVFDRSMELARAGAGIITADTKFILVEGNYLLLDEGPWSDFAPLFDLTVFLDVERAELERRLLQRWHDLGRTDGSAWVASNDMPNVDTVLTRSRLADVVLRSDGAARASPG